MIPENVTNYLNRFSIPGVKLLSNPTTFFNLIIVVPVLREYENLPSLVNSLKQNSKIILSEILVLFVVNNSENSDEKERADNKKSIEFLKRCTEINIAIVDATSPGNELPVEHAGAGLARKIGMDTALKYFDYSSPKKKILVCLDSDCTVSANYLETIDSEMDRENTRAAVIRFEHQHAENEKLERAIIFYELFLRYHSLALKYASSPFAHIAIGSTMVCDHDAYVSVQGMNKKKAGEDFYFLEKLAKKFSIEKINSAVVYPSARISDRVPFGTGTRIAKFDPANERDYAVYNFESYEILKKWNSFFLNSQALTAETYLEFAESVDRQLYNYLEINHFSEVWNKLKAGSKSEKQIMYQKRNWFDAFRTLKLIHHLRDNSFPDENIFVGLKKLLEKNKLQLPENSGNSTPDLNIQKKYLELIRSIT